MIYYTTVHYIFFALMGAGAIWCAYNIWRADMRRRIIPDVYLFPLMLIGMIFVHFFSWPTMMSDAIVGASFGYAIGSLLGIIFDRYMRRHGTSAAPAPIGMGDIKLLATAGIWLGINGLAIALAAASIGGMLWARRAHQKYIPFAPFLIFGGILALLAMTFLL